MDLATIPTREGKEEAPPQQQQQLQLQLQLQLQQQREIRKSSRIQQQQKQQQQLQLQLQQREIRKSSRIQQQQQKQKLEIRRSSRQQQQQQRQIGKSFRLCRKKQQVPRGKKLCPVKPQQHSNSATDNYIRISSSLLSSIIKERYNLREREIVLERRLRVFTHLFRNKQRLANLCAMLCPLKHK